MLYFFSSLEYTVYTYVDTRELFNILDELCRCLKTEYVCSFKKEKKYWALSLGMLNRRRKLPRFLPSSSNVQGLFQLVIQFHSYFRFR